MTREISGLAEIADDFDGVLFDQYGVLHDGRTQFPGARRCLEALKSRDVPAVVLTNSGKRAAHNRDRLARLGFAPDLIYSVVSSGDLARAEIARRLNSGRLCRGARVAILSRDADLGVIDGLDVQRSAIGPDIDLFIIAGIEPEHCDRSGYRTRLAPLAERRVPAICANPDRLMYVDGEVAYGPGVVAEDYSAAGGPVITVGKPAAAMFTAALEALGAIPPDRVLMIGDSLEHDVAGAARAGCATLFVRRGAQGTLSCSAEPPDFAIDRLVWHIGDHGPPPGGYMFG